MWHIKGDSDKFFASNFKRHQGTMPTFFVIWNALNGCFIMHQSGIPDFTL
jgi:hypothetical protein